MLQKFRDLSISAKVIVAFALVLVATVVLGIFAASRLSDVNVKSADVRDNWVPGMRYSAAFQYNATRYRSRQYAVLLDKGALHDKDVNALASLKEEADEALRQYGTVTDSGREHELLERVKTAWNDYTAYQEKLDRINASQGLDAAVAFLTGPMRTSFDDLKTSVDALLVFNNDGAKASGNTAQAVYLSARIWIFVAIGLAVLLCVFAGYALIASVSKPVLRITDAMSELAQGHLTVEVPHADQADEVGKLAVAMAEFKTQLAEAERSKATQTTLIVESIGTGLDHLAKGNLTHRIDADLTGPFAKLKRDFNAAMERLHDTMSGVLTATAGIAGGASEISQAADDLSRRTEQQAASLEETAAALEEITASVKTAAGNANEASTAVATTKKVAEEGGVVVDKAVVAMDAISASAHQVADIIGVIDEIAFQTNLLALNAGVEAARAGDAGRGFAVVASEVRSLAQRSAEAAKQIKSLINASNAHVDEGVHLVGESGSALKRIVEQMAEIDKLSRGSAEASQQQASGIEEVNTAVSAMDQTTQQNAAMVEQSTAASRNLASETQQLHELIGFFDVGLTASVPHPAPAPSAPRPALRVVAKSAKPAPAAVAPGDWEEF